MCARSEQAKGVDAPSPLSELPFDVWTRVLDFLPPLVMLRFFQTCRAFCALKRDVRTLDFGRTPIVQEANALTALRLILGSAALVTLDLSSTKFCSTLESLDLSSNQLCGLDLHGNGTCTDVGIKALAEALRVSSSLKNLNLNWNRLDKVEEAAFSIVRAVKQQDTVEVLGLAGSCIGPAGAAEVADYISFSSALTSLDLTLTLIGASGAKALAGALKVSSALKNLNLACNKIDVEGAKALAGALGSSALKKLDLSFNKIDAEGASALGQGLRDNNTLQELDLTCCCIGAAGAQGLAEGLFSSALTDLELSSNEIGPAGAAALAGALKVNFALTNLNLSGDNFIGPGVDALAEALQTNSTLKKIYVNMIEYFFAPKQVRDRFERVRR